MHKRQLGSTGIGVSPLGLGTVKFGRNTGVKYPTTFELPSDQMILNLLALAQDLGVNLIDTAPAYGTSETRLGPLLRGQRDQWVIVSKAGEEFDGQNSSYDFSPQHIRHSVQRSLQRLETDYIDVLLIHSNGDDLRIIEQDEVFSTLSELKRAGLIRAYGMSTKTVEGGLVTVEHSDVAMVTCHLGYEDEVPVIQAAEKQDKGILVKKAFASGHAAVSNDMESPIQAAMSYVFSHSGVSSVIAGTINPDHLKENIQAVNSV